MGKRAKPAPPDPIDLAAGVVAAYVAGNALPPSALGPLIGAVHTTLVALTAPERAEATAAGRASAARVRRSITPDHLVSFEDGKPYRTLRRHLTLRGLTPEAYRAKWGLPADYPMTAPTYSARRAELARIAGLGRRRPPADPPR